MGEEGWVGVGEPSPVLLRSLLPPPLLCLGSGRGDSLWWWEGAWPGLAGEQEGGTGGQRL